MIRALAVVVLASGCGPMPFQGAPVPGEKCFSSSRLGTAEPECITPSEVALCESGKWVSYSCPGECRPGQSYRCDWTAAKAGDACPISREGTSFCETATAALVCKDGKYVAKPCASQCSQLTRFAADCS